MFYIKRAAFGTNGFGKKTQKKIKTDSVFEKVQWKLFKTVS